MLVEGDWVYEKTEGEKVVLAKVDAIDGDQYRLNYSGSYDGTSYFFTWNHSTLELLFGLRIMERCSPSEEEIIQWITARLNH